MRPLVLVHGFMGGSDQWALQAPLRANRHLITPDLPGFGHNADCDPISSIEGFARWVLDQIEPEQFDLVGHSMGGMIVQEMVRLAPERVQKLILYGTGPVGLLPGRFEPIETSMARATRDGPVSTAKRISATWFLDYEAAPAYQACADVAIKASLATQLAGLEAMRDWSGVDNLSHIACPTLIIWGDQDRTYQWPQTEALWRNIPNTALSVIPGCAHAVHLEKPHIFNAIVTDFLDPKPNSAPA